MGQLNISNAVSYCSYASYLIVRKKLKAAAEKLNKAVEIFSCLSNDHPINWVIHYANGILCEQRNNYEEASNLFKNSLELAVKKFD